MTKSNVTKMALALAMLGFAAYFLYAHFAEDTGISEKAFFYDLSEKKLFTGPRTAVPPIMGINDSVEDGVTAVVVSTTGNPKDKKSWKIAYLEKYSPELKKDLERAQATGQAPQIGRGLAQKLRFVRTEQDTNWYPLDSDKAGQIVNGWATPGPEGITLVVCTPN
jgi:hypothetical protein